MGTVEMLTKKAVLSCDSWKSVMKSTMQCGTGELVCGQMHELPSWWCDTLAWVQAVQVDVR